MARNVIFCYSGTGNCLDIARNIAKKLGDTDIIMMRSKPEVTDVRGARRVGFVFPCYGGGLPGHVEDYVKLITLDKKAYTFGVVSCAGYPGIGLSRIDSVIHLDYWNEVRHQSACIWLMPHGLMLPPMSAEKAQKAAEAKTAKIAQDVFNVTCLDRKLRPNPLNVAENRVWPKIRKAKSEQMSVGDGCVGCGTCVAVCPQSNIRLVDGRAKIGGDCIGCLSCIQFCPQQAINIGEITKKRERYHNVNVSVKDLTEKVIHID